VSALALPDAFWAMRYSGAHHPGAPQTEDPLHVGRANCQVFAYTVLRFFGRRVPDLRSSEIWADRAWSQPVERFEPLDLIFWNQTFEPYGAHVGLYWGDGQALHLARSERAPVVWPLTRFAERARWQVCLGGKRFPRQTSSGSA
jgi:cell wall-associated NlpC family hydrolase